MLRPEYQTHAGHGHATITAGISHHRVRPGNTLPVRRCPIKTAAATKLPIPSHPSAISAKNIMA